MDDDPKSNWRCLLFKLLENFEDDDTDGGDEIIRMSDCTFRLPSHD